MSSESRLKEYGLLHLKDNPVECQKALYRQVLQKWPAERDRFLESVTEDGGILLFDPAEVESEMGFKKDSAPPSAAPQ